MTDISFVAPTAGKPFPTIDCQATQVPPVGFVHGTWRLYTRFGEYLVSLVCSNWLATPYYLLILLAPLRAHVYANAFKYPRENRWPTEGMKSKVRNFIFSSPKSFYRTDKRSIRISAFLRLWLHASHLHYERPISCERRNFITLRLSANTRSKPPCEGSRWISSTLFRTPLDSHLIADFLFTALAIDWTRQHSV